MLSSYMRGLLTRACVTDSIAAMFKFRRMMRMIEQKTVTCILFLLTRPFFAWLQGKGFVVHWGVNREDYGLI